MASILCRSSIKRGWWWTNWKARSAFSNWRSSNDNAVTIKGRLCPPKWPPTIIWKSGKMGKVWETFREMGESSISYSKFHFSSFHFFCKNLQLSCLMFLIAKEMPLLYSCVPIFFSCWSFFSLVTQLQKKVWLLCTSQTSGWKYPKFVLSSTYIRKTKIVTQHALLFLTLQHKKYMFKSITYK